MSAEAQRDDSVPIAGTARQTARPSRRGGRIGRHAGHGDANQPDAPRKLGVDAGVQLQRMFGFRPSRRVSPELRRRSHGAMRNRRLATFDVCSISPSTTGFQRLGRRGGKAPLANSLQAIHHIGAVMRSGECRP